MSHDNQALFSQRDPRWSRQRIGSSSLTIGGYGCTLTSTCRSLFLINEKLLNPSEMENTLSFTRGGLIEWWSFNRIGLKATRVRKQKPKEFKKGMLIELDYWQKYGIMHWVCLESDSKNGTIQVMDPWVGEIVTKPVSEISGYTLLESTEEKNEPTEYEKEVEAAMEWVMKNQLSNGENPKDPLVRQDQWIMMKRLTEKIKEWSLNGWK